MIVESYWSIIDHGPHTEYEVTPGHGDVYGFGVLSNSDQWMVFKTYADALEYYEFLMEYNEFC